MDKKVPSVTDIREVIESFKVDKYRIGLMYQFLIGASISEVCGEYAPIGSDAIKVNLYSEGVEYPAVLFKIKNKKSTKRGKYRVCALPLNSQYEPWANEVLNWFESHKDQHPFNYHQRGLQRIIVREFIDYVWPKDEYYRAREIVERRTRPFRSEELQKLRKKNLKEFYYFTEVDLALYGAWNEPVTDVSDKIEIEEILEMDSVSDTEQCISRAERYFGKLLRYYSQLGSESLSIPTQLRRGADLSRARERAFNIIELVDHINNLGEWNFNTVFFNDNMRLIYEILGECKNRQDFISKIASLTPLFDVELGPLKKNVEDSENKKSIKLIEELLKEKNIVYDRNMIHTWVNIQTLRNMIIHSGIDAKKYIELLIFFGEPPKLPPNYSSLWDNLLNRFISSLKQFHNILNSLEKGSH